MYLDIGICIIFFFALLLGWRTGFMRGIIGFASSMLCLSVSFFSATPLADLFNKWFGVYAKLNKAIMILICGVVVFVIIKVFFLYLSRLVRRIKEESAAIDKIDKAFGVVLGVVKFVVSLSIFFVILYLLNSVPFVNGAAKWLLNKSVIGKFFYDFTVNYIAPLLGDLSAYVIGNLIK